MVSGCRFQHLLAALMSPVLVARGLVAERLCHMRLSVMCLLRLGIWHLQVHRPALWSPLPTGVLTVACRMYAFDVHCNSYFPLFILLYGEAAQTWHAWPYKRCWTCRHCTPWPAAALGCPATACGGAILKIAHGTFDNPAC